MKTTLPFAFAAIALSIAPAAAQPVTRPAEVEPAQKPIAEGALGVEILDPDHVLAADDVRAAIGTELAVPIVDATAFAPRLGRLEIAIEAGVVHVAYHPAAGTLIERTFALPLVPADRAQMIAFIATNLVRDQTGEVLGSLPALAPVAPPAAPPRRASPSRWIPFTLGLVPPLTIDRALGQRVSIGVGVHAIMGMSDETTIATVSGVVDVVTGNMSGAQIGGAVAATLGDVHGAQIGGAVAVTRGSVHGLQIAGAAATARRVDGLQIAGAVNVAKQVDGAQIAGAVNVAGDVRGLQIGVINVAGRMRGVQLGVINLSDDGDDSFPIGVINYSRNGGVAIDGWVDSSRVSALAFRHGTKHVHNLWSVGWSPDHDNLLVGFGLGITHRIAGSLALDVDAMHWLTDIWDGEYGQLDQLRASVSVPLAREIEAFGGVAANAYINDVMQDSSSDFHPTMARTFEPTTSTTVVTWPSAFVGIRLRAR